MGKELQAEAKGAVSIGILETWVATAEQLGEWGGWGAHTGKEALKEAGELEQDQKLKRLQEPGRSNSERTGEMVFTYCIVTFRNSIDYTLSLLKQTLLKFLSSFLNSISFSFPTQLFHVILTISFLLASDTVFFQQAHFAY